MSLPRRTLSVLCGGALVLALGCGRRRPAAPDWVASAPEASVMAISGQAGWLLEQPSLQTYLGKFPHADQALDLFLKKARINPHQETGRISCYLMTVPTSREDLAKGVPEVLIQLGGFKDQAAVHMAITDAFPSEGSLPIGRHELPVYVILDLNQYHFRAVADPSGRIWLGELRSLAKLGSGGLGPRNEVLNATEWINGAAPFQGFLCAKQLQDGLAGRIPPELARNLPQGIEALAWSVTPGATLDKSELHRFELAISGSPEGVREVAPWMQRFAAAATTLQGAPAAQAPEILQERRRIGLRCQLTGEQINQALAKLAQPGLTFGLPKP